MYSQVRATNMSGSGLMVQPLYVRIQDELRERIASGDLGQADAPVPAVDVDDGGSDLVADRVAARPVVRTVVQLRNMDGSPAFFESGTPRPSTHILRNPPKPLNFPPVAG